MRYMLLLYANERVGTQIAPEDMHRFMDQMFAYRAALIKAQAFIETNPLMPTDTACTLRVEDGQMQVLDGPYADTREQLGGYLIIEAADIDEARTWAARCPAATWGSVEVRQIRDLAGL